MSEIPFVNKLGDAIDAATATPQRIRRRLPRRRFGVLALAVLVLGASGVTVARIAWDPERLAIGTVACFETADLTGTVAITGADGGSPIAVCAEAWDPRSGPVPPLLACVRGEGVVVFPRRGVSGCAAVDMEPLPQSYSAAQGKVRRLAREIATLEAQADCIPPRVLARRTQALLERTGWAEWRAVAKRGDGGPCGRILNRGASTPGLHLSAHMDTKHPRLAVYGGPPRSLDRQLFGEHSLGVALMDASGERCHTLPELRQEALSVLAPTRRTVTFKIARMPGGQGMEPPRGDLYAQGCAIAVGAYPVYPLPGEVGVEAELWIK